MAISNGSEVGIEYTLTLADGTVADTNVGKDPLVFTQGAGQILPAMENALVGLSEGDTREVNIPAAEGYGEVDPQAFETVAHDQIPENARQVGAVLVASMGDGSQRQVRVHEVENDHVVIDFNHPLAGEDLSFDVRVVSVS